MFSVSSVKPGDTDIFGDSVPPHSENRRKTDTDRKTKKKMSFIKHIFPDSSILSLNLLIHLLIWFFSCFFFFLLMMYFLALLVTEQRPICNPVSFLDSVKETDVYLCVLLGQSMSHWFWECCVCLRCLHDEWAPSLTEGKNKTTPKCRTLRFCNFIKSTYNYFMI